MSKSSRPGNREICQNLSHLWLLVDWINEVCGSQFSFATELIALAERRQGLTEPDSF